MAQFGGAQREPSMEEILASIRRIIEDSDPVRRPEGYLQPVRPDNDVPSQPSSRAAAESPAAAVETFRSGPRSDDVAASSTSALSVSVEAKAEGTIAGNLVEPVAAPTEPEPLIAEVARPPVPMDAADDWRLGVPVTETAQGSEDMDFDLDDMADAVLRDISSAQSARVENQLSDQSGRLEPDTIDEPRPADPVQSNLVSERTGRQVAASFVELSEALAARNRRNLDEMAEEMLRPMLRDWLDTNLPALVERLVREEIERLAQTSTA